MEQAGIDRVELYENVDVTILRDSQGVATSILSNGKLIEITHCNNLNLSFNFSVQSGGNDKFMYSYSLGFSSIGFNSIEFLNDINSLFGYIPVIRFNSGKVKLINTPLFANFDEYIENSGQFYPITISNRELTYNKLEAFENATPVWILSGGVWNDNGIWIDSEFWID